jgi:arylsulfatase A-like enzyme
MQKFNSLLALLVLLEGAASAQDVLPKPDPPFRGKVDVRVANSTPDWPGLVTAPKGAPNVILILLDDVGFAASSTFGGLVQTPNLDKLAASGLRYNRFHVNAMCSPTRASLLSGRNSHEVGFGMIAESAAGYPGYNSLWPKSAASIAEILKLNGYSTAAFGKWHNTPVWQVNPAGPFDRWPTGLGFEYFYGFMGAQTSQWEPTLYRDTTPVETGKVTKPGYHLTIDLVDDAIRWVHQHDAIAPQKPFFVYFATGATHTPHHVPQEWIDKYKGKFDLGWDKLRVRSFAREKELGVIPVNAELTPRPSEIPAWDSLTEQQKKFLAHQMEVYAAFLAQTDHEIGRLLEAVKDDGHVEDTAIFYIVGDNGASAEGGFEGRDGMTVDGKAKPLEERITRMDELGSEYFTNHYATAWGWSTNAPFQWAKEVASHLGGTRDPLIVSWPGHIKAEGGIRSQFQHVNDIAPTILDIAGIHAPDEVNGVKQVPFEGTSMVYSFDHPDEPSHHHIQYFEMLGSRGIYKDGWWAGSFNHLPWPASPPSLSPAKPENHPWELYNLDADFSQAHNLAAQYPEKVKEMAELFDSEARRNQVYPLEPKRLPQPVPSGDPLISFLYKEGVQRIPGASAPRLAGRAHRITAEVEVPANGAQGVILAQGGRMGGFSLFMKDGFVQYAVNAFGNNTGTIVSSARLTPGKASIVLEFKPDESHLQRDPGQTRSIGPGIAKLSINGISAGESAISSFTGGGGETFDVGADLGSPVSSQYVSPFAFTGKIDFVKVDLE